jgi:hypothetical protein
VNPLPAGFFLFYHIPTGFATAGAGLFVRNGKKLSTGEAGYGTMRIEKKLKRKGEIVYVYTP